MRIHRVTHGSRVNGPGLRNVLHTQGCTVGCSGCFNAHTWSTKGGHSLSVDEIVEDLLTDVRDGVTISGGEPTEQWGELKDLLVKVKNAGQSIVLFTGLNRHELEKKEIWEDLQDLTDILVVGPYDKRKSLEGSPLRGSSNQEVYYFGKYSEEDLVKVPELEVHIDGDTVTVAGFPDTKTRTTLLRELRG